MFVEGEPRLSLEEWIVQVLEYEMEPRDLPDDRCFSRAREVSAQWQALGLSDGHSVQLLSALQQGLGRVALGTVLTASEVELMAVDLLHELVLAMSEDVAGSSHGTSLLYTWHNVLELGNYHGIDPDVPQLPRSAHPMSVPPEETWKVYRRVFERASEESLSANPWVAESGAIGLSWFVGPRKRAALRAIVDAGMHAVLVAKAREDLASAGLEGD